MTARKPKTIFGYYPTIPDALHVVEKCMYGMIILNVTIEYEEYVECGKTKWHYAVAITGQE